MNLTDNVHCERFAWGFITYWENGSACGVRDAWTQAILSGHGGYPEIKFKAVEHYELALHCRLLHNAVEAGKAERSKEFRNLLGSD